VFICFTCIHLPSSTATFFTRTLPLCCAVLLALLVYGTAVNWADTRFLPLLAVAAGDVQA
jgi:hypothetical protein